MQATCLHARVKLLLWDMDTVGEWSLAAQEDAIKLGDSNVTALYNVGADLLEGVPKSMQVRHASLLQLSMLLCSIRSFNVVYDLATESKLCSFSNCTALCKPES